MIDRAGRPGRARRRRRPRPAERAAAAGRRARRPAVRLASTEALADERDRRRRRSARPTGAHGERRHRGAGAPASTSSSRSRPRSPSRRPTRSSRPSARPGTLVTVISQHRFDPATEIAVAAIAGRRARPAHLRHRLDRLVARAELLRLRRLARHLGARRRRRADEPGRAHRRPAGRHAGPAGRGVRLHRHAWPTSGSRSRTSRSAVVRFATGALGVLHAHHRRLPRAERPAAGARRQGLGGHRQRRAHLHPPDRRPAATGGDGRTGSTRRPINQIEDSLDRPEQATASAGRDPGQLSDAHRRQYENFLAALDGAEKLRVDLRDQPPGDRGHHRRLRVGPDRTAGGALRERLRRIAAQPDPVLGQRPGSRAEVFEQAFADFSDDRVHRGQGRRARGHDRRASTSTGSAATASRRRSACSARAFDETVDIDRGDRAGQAVRRRPGRARDGPDHGVLDGRAGPDGATGGRRRLRREPADPAPSRTAGSSARCSSPRVCARCTTPTSAGSSRRRRRSSGCSTTSGRTSSAFGPDTGHLRWAGIDPATFIARYADRIGGIHIKDCFPDYLDADADERSYHELAETKRLWAEPGSGVVDFDAVLRRAPRRTTTATS